MLAELFRSIPSEQATWEIITRFDKLLLKYARLLKYEDAYNDLLLFFIELIYSMKSMDISYKEDPYIVNYITQSIKHHYIKLSRKNSTQSLSFSDLSDEQLRACDYDSSYTTPDKIEHHFPNGNILTSTERDIIIFHFKYGLSISEIATKTGKSRQAINQAKNRALLKLNHFLK